MLTISITELLLMIVILPLAGGIVGYIVSGDRMRKSAGGKDPRELQAEMSEYRARVDDHFRETANLLGAMTEQYRQVYTHMANGAAELCESADSKPQIEQMQRRSLALAAEDDAAVTPAPASAADADAPAVANDAEAAPASAADSRD